MVIYPSLNYQDVLETDMFYWSNQYFELGPQNSSKTLFSV